MHIWQNPILSLGERCVAFSENELKNKVKEDHPGTYTSARIVEYFSICTRLVKGSETPINLKAGNWCASSASFSLHNSLLPGEKLPHGYRVGVVEIVSDLQRNGLWHSIKDVDKGNYNINIGDLVIFDRSTPNKPETMWFRHVARVRTITNNGFTAIGGNSGGSWKITDHKFNQSNLLGFGEYPSSNDNLSNIDLSSQGIDWSHVNLDCLAPLEDTGKDLSSDNFYTIYHSLFKK